MTNPDFKAIRKEYEDHGIDHASLPDCPMTLFRQWYSEAEKHQPAEWFEANAMAVATCDTQGRVSNRIVLLKGIEDRGIRFFTSYDSLKGQQLAENPMIAATFHWPYLGRQVRLEGRVEKTSREISQEYFHERPRGSQLSAAVSPQSHVIASRQDLKAMSQSLDEQYQGQPIPLPENWGGYLIVVERFEFWQGRPDRCHDRAIYRRGTESESWVREVIAP